MNNKFLLALGLVSFLLAPAGDSFAQTNFSPVFTLGSHGIQPYDVAVHDQKGINQYQYTAYVTDTGLNRVWQFNNVTPWGQGNFSTVIWAFGFKGQISGIAVNEAKQHVYVLENTATKTYIRVFNLSGSLLMTVDPFSPASYGIAVGPKGNVYIADESYDFVIKLPSGTFDPSNYGPGIYPSQWVAIYGQNWPYVGNVIDVSVDQAARIHITDGCNCYQVYEQSGTLWSFNGQAAPNLNGQRGVDAKLPFSANGIWSAWIATVWGDHINYLWDPSSNGTNNGTVSGGSGEGCETCIYYLWGNTYQRLFVCEPGQSHVQVYGN